MVDQLHSWLNWAGFFGGASLIAWVVLAMLAPNVLSIIKEFIVGLSPLLKGASEGVVYLAKLFWAGIKDIVDNFNTIVTVLALCVAVFLYAKVDSVKVCTKPDHEAWMKENIRPYYKFVKRTPEETQEYLERTGQSKNKWIPW